MQTYIIRRLLLVVPTMLIVSLIVFFSLRLIPGDAVDLMVAQSAHFGSTKSDETPRDIIRRALGLDLPAHVQYGKWMAGMLQGDLGESLWTKISVSETVLTRLPISLELGFLAIVISLTIALPVGMISGIRPESKLDQFLRSMAILFICIPEFWLGTMVLLYPALWWDWAPRMFYISFFEDPLANLGMMILPATILGLWLSGFTMRFTRTMMLEVLGQDYVRTAWAKGLRERVVVTRHVMKNALIPVVTMIGLQLPVMIGGAVIVEYLFQIPGMGALIVEAVNIRDYPLVSGANLVMAAFVLVINIGVDLSYAWLDPRIRYQ